MKEQKKAQEAGGMINRTRNNAAKEREEQENNFVTVEFPNVNSKVAASGRSTPKREAVTSEGIKSTQFISPKNFWTSNNRSPHQHSQRRDLVDSPTNKGET